ncbi:unnamed protein product, partial [Owenia fusiformis]
EIFEMSHGILPIRPVAEGSKKITLPKENAYGIPDVMTYGLTTVRSDLTTSHPLEYSEKHWREHKDRQDAIMLRNTQGLHAPMRLHMEKSVAQKMQRLPGMSSSHVMLDSLTGRDEMIDFEDIFNTQEFQERVGQPHAMVERNLGLL